MSKRDRTETEFARRLRAELGTIVAERGAARGATTASDPTVRPVWRRRGPRMALAGTAVAAIAAAALIVNAGRDDTPAAFAVEPRPEGIISVEVNSLEDPEGLEAALEEVGIPASVNYLPAGMACKEPRFRRVPWPEGAKVLNTAKIAGEGPNGGAPYGISGPLTMEISRGTVGPGQTLVITASASSAQGSEGGRGFFSPGSQMELAEGIVAPCEPVPAPPDGGDAGG